MGKPFCTCPEGLKRDHNGNCGKNVEHIIRMDSNILSQLYAIFWK